MYRTLKITLFFQLFVSCLSYAEWTEQDILLYFSSSYAAKDSQENNLGLTKNSLNLVKNQFYEGFGLAFSASAAKNNAINFSSELENDHEVRLSSRVFLSRYSNFDVSYKQFNKVELASMSSQIYRKLDSPSLLQKGNEINSSLKLGSDQTIRSLAIEYSQSDFSNLTQQGTNSAEDYLVNISTRFQNLISEDTFFVALFEARESKQEVLEQNNYVEFLNYYIGLKTAYLGNSSIEILLGSSNSSSQMADEEQFSWRVINNIKLKDYLDFNLLAGKVFRESPDIESSKSDLTTYGLAANYKPSTDWAFSLAAEKRYNKFDSGQTSINTVINLRISYQFLSHWKIESGVTLDSLKHQRYNYDGSELSWGLGIRWDVF